MTRDEKWRKSIGFEKVSGIIYSKPGIIVGALLSCVMIIVSIIELRTFVERKQSSLIWLAIFELVVFTSSLVVDILRWRRLKNGTLGNSIKM